MSFAFTRAKRNLMKGDIDFDVDVFKIILLMTNNSLGTSGQEDAATVSAITTLDEHDGANAARKTVTSQAVAENTGSNRAEFTFDPVTWTALGNGTRQIAGYLLIKFVTNDADSIPIAYIDSGGFPVSPGGLNFTITPNANGVLQLT